MAADPFMAQFNKGLDDLRVAGIRPTVSAGGRDWDVVSADKLEIGERPMPGGRYSDVNTTIIVRTAIAQAMGAHIGMTLTFDGEDLRIITIEKDGDDSWTLLCGPSGVSMPRF